MKITGTAKIVIEETDILKIKATAAHLSQAMGVKATIRIYGTFNHKGETVFCDSTPLVVSRWLLRSKIRANVDGEMLSLTPVSIRYAVIEAKS